MKMSGRNSSRNFLYYHYEVDPSGEAYPQPQSTAEHVNSVDEEEQVSNTTYGARTSHHLTKSQGSLEENGTPKAHLSFMGTADSCSDDNSELSLPVDSLTQQIVERRGWNRKASASSSTHATTCNDQPSTMLQPHVLPETNFLTRQPPNSVAAEAAMYQSGLQRPPSLDFFHSHQLCQPSLPTELECATHSVAEHSKRTTNGFMGTRDTKRLRQCDQHPTTLLQPSMRAAEGLLIPAGASAVVDPSLAQRVGWEKGILAPSCFFYTSIPSIQQPPPRQYVAPTGTGNYGVGTSATSNSSAVRHDNSCPPWVRLRNGHTVSLLLPTDHTILTEFQLLIRQSLVLFQVQEQEGAPNYSLDGGKIPRCGQVGIRCKYCQHLEDQCLRVPGACYFPKDTSSIYQAAQNIANFHLLKRCPEVPSGVRAQLWEAKTKMQKNPRRSGGNSYWMETCCHLGLEDRAGERGVWVTNDK